MKLLPLLLAATFLTGCVSYGPDPDNRQANYVKIYKKAELVGLNYQVRGVVSGLSCQSLEMDRPASISLAREKMQLDAGRLGNGVILDKCETIYGLSGCYKAAVCEGTAIEVMD